MKPVKIGLLGLGTVGTGTFRVLERNREEIARRAGRRIEIAWVAVRDVARANDRRRPDPDRDRCRRRRVRSRDRHRR